MEKFLGLAFFVCRVASLIGGGTNSDENHHIALTVLEENTHIAPTFDRFQYKSSIHIEELLYPDRVNVKILQQTHPCLELIRVEVRQNHDMIGQLVDMSLGDDTGQMIRDLADMIRQIYTKACFESSAQSVQQYNGLSSIIMAMRSVVIKTYTEYLNELQEEV